MERTRPAGRTVLVTGAARGIGRATVEAFAAAGWHVFAGVREPDQLVPFGEDGVDVLQMDVTDLPTVTAAVAAAEERSGAALDCVANNAGWALFGAIEDVALQLARQAFDTNFFGAVAVVQAALPGMRRAGSGVVVNVSTLAGRIPLPLFGMYSATKLALAAMSDALALELGASGIRVVHIEAGVVRTDFARSTVISGSAGAVDSVYAPTRDRVLGNLRAIREATGIPPEAVAAAILEAVDDPSSPVRVVLADDGLAPIAEQVGGMRPDAHQQVRRFLGLDDPAAM